MKVNTAAVIDFLCSLSKTDRITVFKRALNQVSEDERFAVIKSCLDNFSTKNKRKLITLISSSLLTPTRYAAIDRWMESIFSNHFEYTPYKVAMMGLYYFKMNHKMKPFMIAYARKVKARVRMRRSRQKNYT